MVHRYHFIDHSTQPESGHVIRNKCIRTSLTRVVFESSSSWTTTCQRPLYVRMGCVSFCQFVYLGLSEYARVDLQKYDQNIHLHVKHRYTFAQLKLVRDHRGHHPFRLRLLLHLARKQH